MKRSSIIILRIVCGLAAAATLSARESVFDSVRVATAQRSAAERFEVMEQFSDSLLNAFPYESIPFTREAIRIAHERGDRIEEGYLLNSLSKAYLNIGEFDSSGEYAHKALRINLDVKHDYEIARTFNLTAVAYTYMGLYTNAMEYSLKALKIYEALKKKDQAASMLNAIGAIYLHVRQYAKARSYFDRSRAMLARKDTAVFTVLVLNNIASTYALQGQADSALERLRPLLPLTRLRRYKGAEAYTLYNMGTAYRVRKEYAKAVTYLELARGASAEIHEAHGEAEASLGIAHVYAETGAYRKLLSTLDETIPYCRRAKMYDNLRDALDLQRIAYERSGDIRRAYASLRAYTALSDSVFTLAERFGVANAAFTGEIAEKEIEISRLRHDAEQVEMSVERKQSLIYTLAAIVAVVIGTAISLVFMYRKSTRLRRIDVDRKRKIEALYEELSKVVSDRRLADDQMRETQRKFQAVWEMSVDGMRLTDKDGRILMVNEAFCRMVGMEREAMTGEFLSVLYDDVKHDETIRLYRERFALRSVETYFERELVLKHARAVWFEVTNTYIEIEDQEPLLLGIFRDVSQRKKLEQQLVHSQKLEGIGTLAGGIAHDFNNLLAMILGAAEMLQRQLTAQPQLQKYVDRIVDASARGASISRQLLIFSRPDQAQLKPMPLSKTVTEVEEMLKHFLPKSIVLATCIDDSADVILGDAGQIQQALLNLAMNAGDAMVYNGALTIREYAADPDIVGNKFPSAPAQPYVALSVSDTGTGMDGTVKRKIFDPFFTTKERNKGTGLGLSIVHGIVMNHHGMIDVDSTPGRGTTFTIYFPVVVHPVADTAEPETAHGTPSCATILVVDDEEMIRETLVEFLNACGHTVHAAAGGKEALELFESHRDDVDIVVTDLGMPEMGGEELFRRLRAIDPDVKVIVSSGYLDGTTKTELLEIGVKEVLTKPVKIHDLQSAINTVMQSS